MNANELRERTKRFAVRVMRMIDSLPKTIKGRTIANQLMRSATSVAANYRAACRGRSKAEFVSKIGIVIEEADESALWIELIIEGKLLQSTLVAPLLAEADEIVSIMTASRRTAQRNLNRRLPNS